MSATFGLAVENFTSAQKTPQIEELLVTARRAEQLGFTSLWAWDHLFLGSRQPFPQLEALTTLAVLATHTTTIELGTGVLVLPIRDPALLAKTAATIQAISHGRLRLGLAAGWYEREFDATGTPFKDRGRIFERNLEICMDLWTQDEVTGTWDDLSFRRVKMLPLPQPRPQVLIGGYVDRVLKRVATLGDGWLTYFYTPEAFTESWSKIRAVRRGGGPRSRRTALGQPAADLHRLLEGGGPSPAAARGWRRTSTPRSGAARHPTAPSAGPRRTAPSRSRRTSTPACRRSA